MTAPVRVVVRYAPSPRTVVARPAPAPSRVRVAVAGPPGRTGAEGPPGEPAVPHVHVQAQPAAVWHVQHGKGRTVGIDVYVAGELVDADVYETSPNETTVVHAEPLAGKALAW